MLVDPARTLGTLALAAMLAACVDQDRGRDRDDGNVFGGGLGGLLGQRLSYREVLGLIVIQELTCKEAATVCGCAVGTVRTRMSRARAALKQTFLDQRCSVESFDRHDRRTSLSRSRFCRPPSGSRERLQAALDQHDRARQQIHSSASADCEPRPRRHQVPHLDPERTIP